MYKHLLVPTDGSKLSAHEAPGDRRALSKTDAIVGK